MSLLLYTYDWVPAFPRGLVRDLRVRWTLEELGRPYQVVTVPARAKSDEHRAMQPFAQVPMLKDGDLTLFESGAILLYLAEDTTLLPALRRAEVTQWLIAALNTVEVAVSGWMNMVLAERVPMFFGPASTPEATEHARQNMHKRLAALEQAIGKRDWLVGAFSVADIMMADVLRIPASEQQLSDFPMLAQYVTRATSRPAFQQALADHMAHWRQADELMAARRSSQ